MSHYRGCGRLPRRAGGWRSRGGGGGRLIGAVAGAVVASSLLGGAVPASAEVPATGWYLEAGKSDTPRVAVYAQGTRLRFATIDGGRGRCVNVKGKRRSVGGRMDFDGWNVRLKPDGRFSASNTGRRTLPWNRQGSKDRFRQWISGRVVGERIVGTYRKRSYYSARGRDASYYPVTCRGRNRFDARLAWAHGARYAGVTSQGRPVEIQSGTPREHPYGGLVSPPRSIAPGSILSLKVFREAPIRSLRTSVLVRCPLTGTTRERPIEVGLAAADESDGTRGPRMRGPLVFGDADRYYFHGGSDQIEVTGWLEGLATRGTLSVTHNYYSNVWPYGEECESGELTFSGVTP
jgi:hypothetical protein